MNRKDKVLIWVISDPSKLSMDVQKISLNSFSMTRKSKGGGPQEVDLPSVPLNVRISKVNEEKVPDERKGKRKLSATAAQSSSNRAKTAVNVNGEPLSAVMGDTYKVSICECRNVTSPLPQDVNFNEHFKEIATGEMQFEDAIPCSGAYKECIPAEFTGTWTTEDGPRDVEKRKMACKAPIERTKASNNALVHEISFLYYCIGKFDQFLD